MYLYPLIICAGALAFSVDTQSAGASVPSDLSGSFDEGAVSLQTSFNGQSDEGFRDGIMFTTQDTAKQPEFALGDSSGVNTAISFLIMMIDTTEDDKRVLHFLQTDFKASGEKTGIASETSPLLAYKAPGSLGESGRRQYSFLLYQQRGTFQDPNMSSLGDAFNVKTFQSDNNLRDPLAGNVMFVNTRVSSGSIDGSSVQPSTVQANSGDMPATQSTVTQDAPSSLQAMETLFATQSGSSATVVATSSTPQQLPATNESSAAVTARVRTSTTSGAANEDSVSTTIERKTRSTSSATASSTQSTDTANAAPATSSAAMASSSESVISTSAMSPRLALKAWTISVGVAGIAFHVFLV